MLGSTPTAASALTLAEAMAAAATNTEAAELLSLTVDGAEATSRTALATALPTLRLTGTSVRNSQAVELGGSSFVRLWDHEASLRAAVDVFRGPAIPTWAAARMGVDAAHERAVWQAAGLRLAAGRAYMAALTARENVDAAAQAVALREASLSQGELLERAGYAVAADTSRARLSVLEARAALVDAEQQLADQLDMLAYLIGAPVPSVEALEAPDLPDAPTQRAATADLAALAVDIEAAERLVRAQRLAFAPVLSVAGQYTIGAESLRAPDGTSWFLSFTATWDIFDFARYGRIDAARIDVAAAELRLDQAERLRRTELTTAQRRVTVARERLAISEQAAAQAEQTRALEAARFDGGDLTILDLVSADAEVFRTRVARNRAALELALARIELAYLSGALQDDEWLTR